MNSIGPDPQVIFVVSMVMIFVFYYFMYWMAESESLTIGGVDFEQLPDVPYTKQLAWVQKELKLRGSRGSLTQAKRLLQELEKKFPEYDLVND